MGRAVLHAPALIGQRDHVDARQLLVKPGRMPGPPSIGEHMKKTRPEYPLFLVELCEPNCPVYWIPEEFADIEFIGTIPFGKTLSDDAMENLLMLSIDDEMNVYVGGVIHNGVLLSGTCIGKVYEKDGRYWHHVFAPESRTTPYAAARAMYKKLRLHRTSIGVNVLKDFQNKRNF